MCLFLATAEATDTSNSTLLLVLVSLGLLACVCALALIPLAISQARQNQHKDALLPLVLIWALLSCGSAIHATVQQFQWSKDQLILLQSGYYDPSSDAAAPARPWWLWIILIAGYAALTLWSLLSPHAPAHSSPEPPRSN